MTAKNKQLQRQKTGNGNGENKQLQRRRTSSGNGENKQRIDWVGQ